MTNREEYSVSAALPCIDTIINVGTAVLYYNIMPPSLPTHWQSICPDALMLRMTQSTDHAF